MNASVGFATESLDAAAAIVRERTGLFFGEARRAAFITGLVAAMRRSRVSDVAAYCARLQLEQALLDDLVAEITIGETYFFREPQQLALIRDRILPAIRSDQPSVRNVRVWSAGCATGEEPYTLAILLREMGEAASARILATDLSRSALAKARKGQYTQWSFRGVPDDIVQRYFRRAGDRFEIAPALRDSVEFGYLNLAEDRYPSLSTGTWGMDLILCRNVLIYFDAETVALVVRRLMDCLTDTGWLLLGATDPPIGDIIPCEVVITNAGLAYRRAAGRRLVRPRVQGTPLAAITADISQEPPASEVRPSSLLAMREPTPAATAEGSGAADDAQSALSCYAAHDYARSAELAVRVVRRDDSDAGMWVVLVRSLANRGELTAAGQACAAALDRHRTAAELAYLHAVLLAAAGHYGEAAVAARRALYLDRGLVVAHMALAGALARSDDVAGARRAFRNAERLLAAMPPEAVVPASDEEPAGRLAEMVRIQLKLVKEAA